jgi:hypothetical protein
VFVRTQKALWNIKDIAEHKEYFRIQNVFQNIRFRCATSRKVPGSIPGRVTGDFFRGIRQFHVPGVDSAFQNEYQDIPGGKDGRCVGLTNLPP